MLALACFPALHHLRCVCLFLVALLVINIIIIIDIIIIDICYSLLTEVVLFYCIPSTYGIDQSINQSIDQTIISLLYHAGNACNGSSLETCVVHSRFRPIDARAVLPSTTVLLLPLPLPLLLVLVLPELLPELLLLPLPSMFLFLSINLVIRESSRVESVALCYCM